jgi:hypothetical protein
VRHSSSAPRTQQDAESALRDSPIALRYRRETAQQIEPSRHRNNRSLNYRQNLAKRSVNKQENFHRPRAQQAPYLPSLRSDGMFERRREARTYPEILHATQRKSDLRDAKPNSSTSLHRLIFVHDLQMRRPSAATQCPLLSLSEPLRGLIVNVPNRAPVQRRPFAVAA